MPVAVTLTTIETVNRLPACGLLTVNFVAFRVPAGEGGGGGDPGGGGEPGGGGGGGVPDPEPVG